MFLIFLYICFSRASSVPSSPVAINKLLRSSTNPFFTNNIQPSKDPPKYDEAIKNRQVSTSFKSQFLPAATKLWPRLCFYTCVWFCSQGGVSGQGEPPRQGDPPAGRTPPGKETPRQGEPPRAKRTPPGRENPPPRHTVNERPVRILLECILVHCSFTAY